MGVASSRNLQPGTAAAQGAAPSGATAGSVDGPPLCSAAFNDDVVVVRAENGKLKVRRERLTACESDYLDTALAPAWVRRDQKGRAKVHLPASEELVSVALSSMRRNSYAPLANWSPALQEEFAELVDFLQPRPLLAAREAAARAAEATAAAAQAVLAGYVRIEPGTFTMGSPLGEAGRSVDEVVHRVTLTRPFLMKATPVTQGQYRELMPEKTSMSAAVADSDGHPAVDVTWFQALTYCNALSRHEGLTEAYRLGDWDGRLDFAGESEVSRVAGANGYRLPTEAEWEYAARAGSPEARYGALDAIAWHAGNASGTAQAVGQKLGNAWGLHDMLGNVWEWTGDLYNRHGPHTAVGQGNPVLVGLGTRVIRGGSWHSRAGEVRAASRDGAYPPGAGRTVGFRPVREPDCISGPPNV